MRNLFSAKVALSSVLMLVVPLAHAGRPLADITVRWEGAASPIPTLGTIGLLLGALLLLVAGFRVLKANPANGKLMGMLLVAGGVMFSAKGVTALNLSISSPEECKSGSISYFYTDDLPLTNECRNAVTITGYQYPLVKCEKLVDQCPVGTILPGNGGSCELNYFDFAGCEQR